MINSLQCVTLAFTVAETKMALSLKAPFQDMFNVLDISNYIWLNLGIQLVSPDARFLFACFFAENCINWLRHSWVPLWLKILNVSIWERAFFFRKKKKRKTHTFSCSFFIFVCALSPVLPSEISTSSPHYSFKFLYLL